MLTPRTIADFKATGFALTVFCADGVHCHHGAPADLDALAERLGEGFDLYGPELRRRFRCTACGHRGATFIISPP